MVKKGDKYIWAPPGRVPMEGEVESVNNSVVRFTWDKTDTGYPYLFPLPLDEFFFKLEAEEK